MLDTSSTFIWTFAYSIDPKNVFIYSRLNIKLHVKSNIKKRNGSSRKLPLPYFKNIVKH